MLNRKYGRKSSLLLASLLALPLFAYPYETHAEDEGTQQSLEETMDAMRDVEQENEELLRKHARIERELGRIQGDLVEIARKIKQQERILFEMETGLTKLSQQEKILSSDLGERQLELSQLLQSMVKLSKMPPELVIAMPGDFAETLRTAKILGLSSRALSDRAGKIRSQIDKIHELQLQITENRDKIRDRKEDLEDDQSKLESKIATRSELQGKILTKQEDYVEELARLSKESSTLKDLLSQIEESESESAKLAMVPKSKPSIKTKRISGAANFNEAKGKISLPAEGKIFSFYGDKTDEGAQARGISIQTRNGAQVTALFGGEVVYTGPFRDYGNLVIVRHDGDFHSLLAGMGRITCQTGQTVLEGEPLGSMGQTEPNTQLYVEIRKDNRPIDPIPWLAVSDQVASKRQIIR